MRNVIPDIRICLLTCIIAVMPSGYASAQTELEYKYELGGALGGMSYMGDANPSNMLSNTEFTFGAIGRWNINPRMALKGNILYGKVCGIADNFHRLFPNVPQEAWNFNNTLVDASCTYELHFWGYGTGKSYKGTHRLVPYIQMGVGTTIGKDVFTLNFPLGVGVKYKITDRWNVGFDWAMHISLSDDLDNISDPYNMESGFMKNNDTYSTALLYLSYDFMPKLRKCNN